MVTVLLAASGLDGVGAIGAIGAVDAVGDGTAGRAGAGPVGCPGAGPAAASRAGATGSTGASVRSPWDRTATRSGGTAGGATRAGEGRGGDAPAFLELGAGGRTGGPPARAVAGAFDCSGGAPVLPDGLPTVRGNGGRFAPGPRGGPCGGSIMARSVYQAAVTAECPHGRLLRQRPAILHPQVSVLTAENSSNLRQVSPNTRKRALGPRAQPTPPHPTELFLVSP